MNPFKGQEYAGIKCGCNVLHIPNMLSADIFLTRSVLESPYVLGNILKTECSCGKF